MSDYVKVVLEAYPGGRLNISALTDEGAGHGYRIAGPKFIDAHVRGEQLTAAISHQLDDRDASEIRSYLRTLDRIVDPGWDEAAHTLTAALDRWKAHSLGTVNHHRDREPEAREALVTACLALAAALGEVTA